MKQFDVALHQGSAGSAGDIAPIAADAARRGALMLVCSEMSATGYNIGPLIAERAEPRDGPLYDAMAAVAIESSIALVYGYPEASDGQVFNSVQVIGRDGSPLASYRKTHLFGDLDRSNFAPGQTLIEQFDFGGMRCGLLICYDVEFPEVVRAHADSGTEWLIVPTGLMTPYELVAEKVVPARAYESQMFVTYVNRCGIEADLEYCGSSCAIAPDGAELGRAGRGEQLLTVTIDPSTIARSRSVNTHLTDRRSDLYSTQEKTT